MPKQACLVIIGNEILSGRTQDANTIFVARRLAQLGIALEDVRIIPDKAPRIITTVNECRAAYDYVFTTGGIGPTHDDITSICIAEAFGVGLKKHQPSFDAMLNMMGVEKFNKARQRMAYLPDGATSIDCDASIAPGYRIGNVFVLAGVPRIMQSMFLALKPHLKKGLPLTSISWHGTIGEGTLAEGLEKIQDAFPDVDLGSYPYDDIDSAYGVALVAKGYDAARVAIAGEAIQNLFVSFGVSPQFGEPQDKPINSTL